MNVIIIDDTYGYEKSSRYYDDYSPALRSERYGLKTVINNETAGGERLIEIKEIKDGVAYFDKGTFDDIENDKGQADFSDCNYRIRKLTPKECWRLQGFSDESFERAREALNNKFYKGKDKSSSQLYKQAGNSIVTDVLFYIFLELYKAMPYLFEELKVSSYFSGIGAFEIALDRLFDCINSGNFQTPQLNCPTVVEQTNE